MEEEDTLFNNITLVRHYSYNFNIVYCVILSGNRMAVRRLPAIPSCKLYISEKIMTSGECTLKKSYIASIASIITCIIYNISALYANFNMTNVIPTNKNINRQQRFGVDVANL